MKRAILVAVLALPLAASAEFSGRVLNVADGDTLTVLVNERDQVVVRLAGIDAPERQQSFGRQAQNNLSALIFGKDVRVANEKRGSNGHMVAQVWVAEQTCGQPNCPKTVDVGLAQIAGGFAWNSKGLDKELPADERGQYDQAEFLAKVRRLGLWGDPKPVSPWAWRHNRLDE